MSLLLSCLIAIAATVIWYIATYPIRDGYLGAMFWQRGPIPIPTTALMFWAVAILVLKWLRLQQQKNAMLLDVLPTEISPQITVDSLDGFIDNINGLPGASSDSFLINRVVRGIEHFRVRKNTSETVTMMESQSAIDANNVSGSYTIVKVFIWALPILGFIGTVMGVSTAVASLAGSLSGGESMDAMKAALQDVFAGLGTAFDTTLLALVMSMLVKIPASALQKSEEDLITSVDEYCNENLLRRLSDGREGNGSSDAADANPNVFRTAVEQALGTHHAEMERWLEKLDGIGERLAQHVSDGWDNVNQRIEKQQHKQLTMLQKQQLDHQEQLQNQFAAMTSAANQIQTTLSQLTTQTETLHSHLAGVASGLDSLSVVLQRLGDQQVIVQQIESESVPRRRWFGAKKSSLNGQ